MLKNLLRGPSLVVVLLVLSMLARGQFNIAILPSGGVYLRSQLWNVSVSNTGTTTVQATLHLDLKDIQTHQTVLSGQSAPFRVGPGVRKVEMSSLEPIVYSYGPGVRADRSGSGLLPIGKFQVCYELVWTYGEQQAAVADDCDEIEVEPLSPPMLTMPENDSVVDRAHPNFTWVPPAPLAMFADLQYDILISPLYEGQSGTDAIQQNLPLQQSSSLHEPFFTYPLQGPQLESGKRYVWQIIARDGPQYAVKSEVWTFRTADKPLATNDNVIYLLLDEKTTGRESIDADVLHLKYVSPMVHMALLQLKTEDGMIVSTKTLALHEGENYLHVPLSRKFQRKQTYTAALQEPDGKVVGISFTIK